MYGKKIAAGLALGLALGFALGACTMDTRSATDLPEAADDPAAPDSLDEPPANPLPGAPVEEENDDDNRGPGSDHSHGPRRE